MGDGKGNNTVLVGEDTDGDIESVGKSGFRLEGTVVILVLEHHDGIGKGLVVLGREWVQDALGQPQSAFGVER